MADDLLGAIYQEGERAFKRGLFEQAQLGTHDEAQLGQVT